MSMRRLPAEARCAKAMTRLAVAMLAAAGLLSVDTPAFAEDVKLRVGKAGRGDSADAPAGTPSPWSSR